MSESAAERLRSYISSGRLPEGTKITEREVSTLLGVSRVPAREALMILEAEGLVIVRPGGRYVTTLIEKDVRDLHVPRCNLETLAILLAAQFLPVKRATRGADIALSIVDSMRQFGNLRPSLVGGPLNSRF